MPQTTVSKDCVPAFEDVKKQNYEYILYKLEQGEFVVDKKGQGHHDEFLADVPETECRYAAYNLRYELSVEEGRKTKLLFVSWRPDDARIKEKMMYSSAKDDLRRSLSGVQLEILATDASELSYEYFVEKCEKGRGRG